MSFILYTFVIINPVLLTAHGFCRREKTRQRVLRGYRAMGKEKSGLLRKAAAYDMIKKVYYLPDGRTVVRFAGRAAAAREVKESAAVNLTGRKHLSCIMLR